MSAACGVFAAVALALALDAPARGQAATTTYTPVLPPGTMGAPAPGPRAATGTGIVIGRVLDITTGQPVSGAIVTIGATSMVDMTRLYIGGPRITTSTPAALDGSSRSSDLRVMSDSQGRFAFLDLPKGALQFGVNAGGYIGGGYGMRRPGGAAQPLELADGQHVTDVILPLWRFGAMAGTIVDEAGEPVVGMPVTVLRWQVTAGRRQLVASGQSGATDDRGIYRIGLLIPGEYVIAAAVTQSTKPLAVVQQGIPASGVIPPDVAAALPGSASAVQVGDQILSLRNIITPLPAAGRAMVYETVFYPSARSAAESTTVTVAPGEQRSGLDLQLRLVPGARVSGVVTGPAGAMARIALRLLPTGLDDLASDSGFEAASTTSDASGAFLFAGVPPGRYVLRGTTAAAGGPTVRASPGADITVLNMGGAAASSPASQALFIDQPIFVGDDDLANLAATMRPGAGIKATLQFDGAKERPSPDTFRSIAVTMTSADAHTLLAAAASARTPFDATGQATTGGFSPGRYLLAGSGAPAGWFFKAALFDGRDLSSSPLELGSADVSGVTIVFADRTSDIAGTVQTAAGANDPDATVLLFPADDHLWTDSGGSPRRLKTMRVTKTGGFALSAVPEGDYCIVAVRDDVMGPWPAPAFLATLRGVATRISIVDGDHKTVNLRTAK